MESAHKNDRPLWLDPAEYPFTSRYVTIHGQRLHYIDEGAGEPLLYVHGTPSWSFDFRNVIKGLARHFRCVAMDHIGFGLSGKPEHYDYSTIQHSRLLETFIEIIGLTNITLVVHDFGGPIGLRYAISNPRNVKNIVILNSWLWSAKLDPAFKKLKSVLKSPLLPLLYRYLNFSARFVLPKAFGEKKLPKEILRHYTKPFSFSSQRNGTIAFASSLLTDQDWFEALWQQRQIIQNKPTLLLWGMKDPLLSPAYLEKFAQGFPNAVVQKVESAGHFPQEEEPELLAHHIKTFMLNAPGTLT